MRLIGAGLNWVDMLIVLLLLIGVSRGRRRGMSEELLDVIKWLTMVVMASYLYGPLGAMLAENTVLSLLTCYLTVYLSIVLLVNVAFTFLKHQVGDKLLTSDVFGRSEYYLGMCAGAMRYACVIILSMALINARSYTPEEINAQAQFQQKNFGSISFPTLGSLQQQVFAESSLGNAAHNYLPALLIHSTPPESKGLQQAGIVRAREQTINEILDSR